MPDPSRPIDRTTPPPIGPTPPLRLPTAERHVLGCGLELLLLPHDKAPVVHCSLVLPAGAARDPLGMAGLTGLTAGLLDEGTELRSSLELADELDGMGAGIGAGSGWDATFANLNCLTRHLDRAAGLFAEVVTRPALADHEWQRLRKQRLDGLTAAADQPGTLAAWAFDSTLFSARHPYGFPSGGTPSTVGRIGLGDLRECWSRTFRPAGAAMVVVGDVTAGKVVPLFERLLAGWTGGSAASEPPPPPVRPPGVRITVVDKPGAKQSVLRVGHAGLPRSHADYFPVRVLNTLLGGSFAGRINRNLREQKGWTYGAGSGWEFRRSPGPFTVHASVHTPDTAPAVAEVVRELHEIRGSRPPTPAETDSARNYMTRGFVRHFETARQIGDNWAALVMHRLPDDFFNTWVDTVNAVTADDCARAASLHIRPDELDVVLAGDASVVVGPLEALGLGSVRVVDRTRIFEEGA